MTDSGWQIGNDGGNNFLSETNKIGIRLVKKISKNIQSGDKNILKENKTQFVYLMQILLITQCFKPLSHPKCYLKIESTITKN